MASGHEQCTYAQSVRDVTLSSFFKTFFLTLFSSFHNPCVIIANNASDAGLFDQSVLSEEFSLTTRMSVLEAFNHVLLDSLYRTVFYGEHIPLVIKIDFQIKD